MNRRRQKDLKEAHRVADALAEDFLEDNPNSTREEAKALVTDFFLRINQILNGDERRKFSVTYDNELHTFTCTFFDTGETVVYDRRRKI